MNNIENDESAFEHKVNNLPAQTQLLLVGIGASAGGVQALKDFFEHVPAESGIAYVVILHLSPEYDSQLTNVLQQVCAMPVIKVTEKVPIVANHVYVVPPNGSLKLSGKSISVEQIHTIEERRAPIDIFFRTLSETNGAGAVAVVLSGTGADGSMGLKRIKENGGVVFVQNPREAEYSDMPRNAIATELVDEILNVADIAGKIIAYKNHIGTVAIPNLQEELEERQQAALREIFTQLRIRTGHDFSNYKRATILRRIERRINVRGLHSLPAYAAFLRETPEETGALLKDLLISVTNFFRDKESFDYFETAIIPQIIQNKTAENGLRIWVAGCATGEEAYSLAMLFYEKLYNENTVPAIQIFATDIDDAAIAAARDGFYTLNDAADVSPERMRRFFIEETGGYRIKKELREMVLFASHNVLKDAPFSRVDLITCRNLLIYFNSAAQNRVMETFHFALKPGGYLFIGSSESADSANDLFVPANKEHQVFQSRHVTTRPIPVPDNSLPNTLSIKMQQPENRSQKITTAQETNALERISLAELHQRLLEQYAPPSLVINENHDVVHVSENAGRFLQVTGGEPSSNIFKLIKQELRLELRTALYQAQQNRTNIEVKNLLLPGGSETEIINLHVRPVLQQNDTARGFILVIFEPSREEKAKDVVQLLPSPIEPITRQLEEELTNVKMQLRLSNEQFEVQTEELKASNEELQAINEELRSATEELETSKEELQSINEELITVNQELKIKVEEVSQSNNDFLNLINSSDIGTVFLDRNFRVKLFTPAAREVFNFIQSDIGRPMSDITSRLEYNDLLTDVEAVLQKLQPVEREVRAANGRTYLMQIQPYRTAEDRIKGIVLVFVNISRRKQAEEAARQLYEHNTEILESISDAFYAVDADFNFTYINKKAEELWGRRRDVLIGKNCWTEFPAAINSESYHLHQKVLAEGKAVQYETFLLLNNRWADVSIYPNERGGLSCYFRDITNRRHMQEALRSSEENLRLAIEAGNIGTCDWNYQTDEMRWNNIRFRMYGIEPLDKLMFVAEAAAFIHPDDRKGTIEKMRTGVETTGKHAEEYRIVHPDGSVHWIVENGRVVEWQNDKPLRVISVIFDITAQHQSDEAIRKSEERLRVTVESATDYVIITHNAGGIIEGWNSGATRIIGHEPIEAIGNMGDIIFTAEDRAAGIPDEERRTAMEEGRAADERWHIRKDGSRFFMNGVLAPIRSNNELTGYVKVARDMTAQKHAEEALSAAQNSLNTAVSAAQMGVWDINFVTGIVTRSLRHDQLLGYDTLQEEWSTDKARQYLVEEDKAEFDAAYQNMLANGTFSLEARVKHPDGVIKWIDYYGRVFRNDKGDPVHAAGVILDITDRKEIEQKKDEFIGIASHELKTPVTSIKVYTEILHDQFLEAGDEQSAMYLKKLNSQVDRLTRLIRDLLDATRISAGRLQFNTGEVDINQLLRETSEDLQRITDRHTIQMNLQELPAFTGDKVRLQQVFVNLVGNAVKYSPEANKVIVKSYIENGNINIEIEDFGIGMNAETQDQLFERFFRSNDPNSITFPGLGLGLYISQEIIKQYKGTIVVRSEKGKGSLFTVVLPIEG